MRAVAPDLTVQYALGVATELVRTVGRNLRRLRGNMPREDLAERAGVHPNTIYLLESEGAKDLKFSTIEALAPALGVTFEDLVLGEPATPEQVQQSFEAFRASGLAPDLRPEEERDLLRDPVLRFGAPPPAAWFYTLQRLRVMRAPSEGR